MQYDTAAEAEVEGKCCIFTRAVSESPARPHGVRVKVSNSKIIECQTFEFRNNTKIGNKNSEIKTSKLIYIKGQI